jgi:hypothetical protein
MSHTVRNVLGQFGETDVKDKFPPDVETYEASTTVTAKNVVAIGTDGKVARMATDGTASLTLGVALDAGSAAGDTIRVAADGAIVSGVPVDGTVSAGSILKRSVTTSGSLAATATPAAGEACAVAIAASASNVATVLWCKSL